jgi:nitrate/nitrite transport system substrate-binding protein
MQSKTMNRRTFLRTALIAGTAPFILSACGGGAAATSAEATAETTAPAGDVIRIGFIPLTDCASVVMAGVLGLYAQYGLNVEVSKESSWANVRDKLITGELDAAHCLFGMPFSVYTGVGGTAEQELKIAMMLSANGQAITLANPLAASAGYANLAGVPAAVDALRESHTPTFAMTFPGGTHDMWLRYWLAAANVDQSSVQIITIPPPQMVANMSVGSMDGFCVGEPWNGVAVKDGIGYTHIASQDIWTDHPEKALVVNPTFAANRRDDLKKVMRAVMEASIWLDDMEHRAEAATVIGGAAYVNAPADVIDARLMGNYNLGADLGEKSFTDDYMLFHKGGAINYPRKSHAIWYMSQYMRFGYLNEAPDFAGIAEKLIMQDLYEEVAGEMSIAVPDDDMSPFTLKLDNVTFDPSSPIASLRRYAQYA